MTMANIWVLIAIFFLQILEIQNNFFDSRRFFFFLQMLEKFKITISPNVFY